MNGDRLSKKGIEGEHPATECSELRSLSTSLIKDSNIYLIQEKYQEQRAVLEHQAAQHFRFIFVMLSNSLLLKVWNYEIPNSKSGSNKLEYWQYHMQQCLGATLLDKKGDYESGILLKILNISLKRILRYQNNASFSCYLSHISSFCAPQNVVVQEAKGRQMLYKSLGDHYAQKKGCNTAVFIYRSLFKNCKKDALPLNSLFKSKYEVVPGQLTLRQHCKRALTYKQEVLSLLVKFANIKDKSSAVRTCRLCANRRKFSIKDIAAATILPYRLPLELLRVHS